ncbi:hypothetical protein RO3G_08444 [Rhizopus delemar RA 99-880]|uniref:triacylglycerol lipase n=1 Tax=Rhizopus delemar (strain RA 99-880 / ATCC MYA-4621 / FGSC 9543 / NRRL 43880) TaxID=246409 RepID=I1C5K9_RHIO9|nr:hypothetical protein RO3G_08444 [Rhizopus delemar RA 99-880]|eukprot:EIE83739.1 hypothetical protein RO3G_08444 [Rhizopus delemar RA 99-880]
MAMLLLLCFFTVFTLTNCFTFQHAFSSISNKEHTLKLKHIYHHASANGPIPKLFRKYDINPSVNVMSNQDNSYSLRSKLQVIERPTASDINEFLTSDNRWRNTVRSMYLESSIGLVPDIEQRESILALAQMTNNAYLDINLNETDWYDLGPQWQVNDSFGWDSDGIRGHDNALFSCCCARISRAWTPVCDCYKNNDYICENSCLEKKISESELYYDNALELYKHIYNTYKGSTIWITGHSLGGALASLVGQTFGVPTVTFEIPGDRLASTRLHLPHAPGGRSPVWHFGHTADPIFVGVCTGPASSCWYGGYAMESRCHTGKVNKNKCVTKRD